jgi:hypothetical protein
VKVLETIRRARGDRFFERESERLDALRFDAATLVISADAVLADPGTLAPVDRFVERNRASGRRLVLWAQGPSAWYRETWPDPAAIGRTLGGIQRAASARWRPDWVVISGDPLLANALLGARGDTVAASGALTALADSVRAGSAHTRSIVAGLEPFPSATGEAGADSLADERETLFRWAGSDRSRIECVGISLSPGYADAPSFQRRLHATAGLLSGVGKSKAVWIVECASSPVTSGEQAQSALFTWIERWASEQPNVEGVSFSSLGDYEETVGMYSALGRARPATRALPRREGR